MSATGLDVQSEALDRSDEAQIHRRHLRAYEPGRTEMRALTKVTLANPDAWSEALVEERYQMSLGKNYESQLARAELPSPPP